MSQKLVESLQNEFGPDILAATSNHGDESVTVAPGKLLAVLGHLRDKGGCEQLSDVVGVDFPDRTERFEVVCTTADSSEPEQGSGFATLLAQPTDE